LEDYVPLKVAILGDYVGWGMVCIGKCGLVCCLKMVSWFKAVKPRFQQIKLAILGLSQYFPFSNKPKPGWLYCAIVFLFHPHNWDHPAPQNDLFAM
jgi:hypothetical protein